MNISRGLTPGAAGPHVGIARMTESASELAEGAESCYHRHQAKAKAKGEGFGEGLGAGWGKCVGKSLVLGAFK
jgi:hypothetical protein